MRSFICIAVLFLAGIIFTNDVHGQCDFKSKIATDGNLYYFIRPENFYWTEAKSLSGGIITDKEYYYLALNPFPCPLKKDAKKIKDNLKVKLANDTIYELELYYLDYDKSDSIMEVLYLIGKKNLNAFVRHEIHQVLIPLGDETGIRTYNLKLHRNALQEQLNCFIEDKKTKKEKKDD